MWNHKADLESPVEFIRLVQPAIKLHTALIWFSSPWGDLCFPVCFISCGSFYKPGIHQTWLPDFSAAPSVTLSMSVVLTQVHQWNETDYNFRFNDSPHGIAVIHSSDWNLSKLLDVVLHRYWNSKLDRWLQPNIFHYIHLETPSPSVNHSNLRRQIPNN